MATEQRIDEMNPLSMYDELRVQLINWKKQNRGEHPKLIVMHPATYNEVERVFATVNASLNPDNRPFPYGDIEICRSLDVEPGVFKIV